MKMYLGIVLCVLAGCEKQPANTAPNLPASALIQQARNGEEATSIEAIKSLRSYRDVQTVDALKSLTKDARVATRYYAAESLWYASGDAEEVVQALRTVVHDPLGWSFRDRMIPLFKKMGPKAKPLIPDIQKAIEEAPNSKVQKWQECLNAISE